MDNKRKKKQYPHQRTHIIAHLWLWLNALKKYTNITELQQRVLGRIAGAFTYLQFDGTNHEEIFIAMRNSLSDNEDFMIRNIPELAIDNINEQAQLTYDGALAREHRGVDEEVVHGTPTMKFNTIMYARAIRLVVSTYDVSGVEEQDSIRNADVEEGGGLSALSSLLTSFISGSKKEASSEGDPIDKDEDVDEGNPIDKGKLEEDTDEDESDENISEGEDIVDEEDVEMSEDVKKILRIELYKIKSGTLEVLLDVDLRWLFLPDPPEAWTLRVIEITGANNINLNPMKSVMEMMNIFRLTFGVDSVFHRSNDQIRYVGKQVTHANSRVVRTTVSRDPTSGKIGGSMTLNIEGRCNHWDKRFYLKAVLGSHGINAIKGILPYDHKDKIVAYPNANIEEVLYIMPRHLVTGCDMVMRLATLDANIVTSVSLNQLDRAVNMITQIKDLEDVGTATVTFSYDCRIAKIRNSYDTGELVSPIKKDMYYDICVKLATYLHMIAPAAVPERFEDMVYVMSEGAAKPRGASDTTPHIATKEQCRKLPTIGNSINSFTTFTKGMSSASLNHPYLNKSYPRQTPSVLFVKDVQKNLDYTVVALPHIPPTLDVGNIGAASEDAAGTAGNVGAASEGAAASKIHTMLSRTYLQINVKRTRKNMVPFVEHNADALNLMNYAHTAIMDWNDYVMFAMRYDNQPILSTTEISLVDDEDVHAEIFAEGGSVLLEKLVEITTDQDMRAKILYKTVDDNQMPNKMEDGQKLINAQIYPSSLHDLMSSDTSASILENDDVLELFNWLVDYVNDENRHAEIMETGGNSLLEQLSRPITINIGTMDEPHTPFVQIANVMLTRGTGKKVGQWVNKKLNYYDKKVQGRIPALYFRAVGRRVGINYKEYGSYCGKRACKDDVNECAMYFRLKSPGCKVMYGVEDVGVMKEVGTTRLVEVTSHKRIRIIIMPKSPKYSGLFAMATFFTHGHPKTGLKSFEDIWNEVVKPEKEQPKPSDMMKDMMEEFTFKDSRLFEWWFARTYAGVGFTDLYTPFLRDVELYTSFVDIVRLVDMFEKMNPDMDFYFVFMMSRKTEEKDPTQCDEIHNAFENYPDRAGIWYVGEPRKGRLWKRAMEYKRKPAGGDTNPEQAEFRRVHNSNKQRCRKFIHVYMMFAHAWAHSEPAFFPFEFVKDDDQQELHQIVDEIERKNRYMNVPEDTALIVFNDRGFPIACYDQNLKQTGEIGRYVLDRDLHLSYWLRWQNKGYFYNDIVDPYEIKNGAGDNPMTMIRSIDIDGIRRDYRKAGVKVILYAHEICVTKILTADRRIVLSTDLLAHLRDSYTDTLQRATGRELLRDNLNGDIPSHIPGISAEWNMNNWWKDKSLEYRQDQLLRYFTNAGFVFGERIDVDTESTIPPYLCHPRVLFNKNECDEDSRIDDDECLSVINEKIGYVEFHYIPLDTFPDEIITPKTRKKWEHSRKYSEQ